MAIYRKWFAYRWSKLALVVCCTVLLVQVYIAVSFFSPSSSNSALESKSWNLRSSNDRILDPAVQIDKSAWAGKAALSNDVERAQWNPDAIRKKVCACLSAC